MAQVWRSSVHVWRSVQVRQCASPLFDKSLNRGYILVGQAFPLVFPPEDFPQFREILEERNVVVRPRLVTFELRLNAPPAAKLLRPDLPALAFGGSGSPFVDVADSHKFLRHCLP